jgi:hypothetical protein
MPISNPIPDQTIPDISSNEGKSEIAPNFPEMGHNASEFDMLLEGALSLDYSLLEGVNSISDTNENLGFQY